MLSWITESKIQLKKNFKINLNTNITIVRNTDATIIAVRKSDRKPDEINSSPSITLITIKIVFIKTRNAGPLASQ